MKKTSFAILLLAIAIPLLSCAASLEETASMSGITVIQTKDESDPVMQELLSKCRPTGKIEHIQANKGNDRVIARAKDLGANTIYIYYTDYQWNNDYYYVSRFWICNKPIGAIK